MSEPDPFATEYQDALQYGEFHVLRELGHGGMGTVYAAQRNGSDKVVALKTLLRSTPDLLRRLKSEFRILADLGHPNLVQLGELVTTEREPFFTMEFISGCNFSKYVSTGYDSAISVPKAFNEARLRNALKQLAEGLIALHEAGCLHRDLKPSNVMVTEAGRVVIMDLGLAVTMNEGVFANDAKEFAGTPFYMAPEQAAGEAVTSAADWYAVGAMLFEALTAQLPFQSRAIRDLQAEKRKGAPEPNKVAADIPRDLNDLCKHLLEPDPMRRANGYDILRVVSGLQLSEAVVSTWVGRSEELAALQRAWDQTREGQGQVVWVTGLSGMGKSSLVERFLHQLQQQQPVTVLRGRCYANEQVSYRGFDSLLDSLATQLKRRKREEVERITPVHIRELCQLFPTLRDVPHLVTQEPQRRQADPIEIRRQASQALLELFVRLSRWEPLVIFIDDLHWGDEDTAALLTELIRENDMPTALVLATFRSEEESLHNRCLSRIRRSQLTPLQSLGLAPQLELEIGPLNTVDATQLAAELLQDTSNKDSIQRIVTESQGDPFFIRVLAKQARTVSELPMGTLSKQLTLSGVLWNQVCELSEDQRRAVEVLAVAGRPLNQSALEQIVCFEKDPTASLRQLRVGRIIRQLNDEKAVLLYHDKVRLAVIDRLQQSQIADHCRRLANELARDNYTRDCEFLADLNLRSGDLENAGELYCEAGTLAAEKLAFHQAAKLFEQAIRLLVEDSAGSQVNSKRTVQLRVAYADALALSTRSAQAAEQYQIAAQLSDTDARPKLLRQAALRWLISGHVDKGTEALLVALKSVRLTWPRTKFQTFFGLLRNTLWLKFAGIQNKSLKPLNENNDPETLARLDACWAAVAGLSVVDPIRGAYFVTENLRLALHSGNPICVQRALTSYVGHVAISSRGRRDTCRALKAANNLAHRYEHPYFKGMLQLGRGVAALLRGKWAHSLHCCDRALGYLKDERCQDVTWETSTARTFALWALQYQGNIVELARRQPELIRIAEQSNDLYAALNYGTQVMTHIQLAADQPQTAQELLQEDAKRLSSRGFFVQHHNHLLASTYLAIYQGRAQFALNNIQGKWSNYKRSFLSQVQQMRIDYWQIYCRAALADAETNTQSLKLVAQIVRRLRRENIDYSLALATAFEAAACFLKGEKERAKSCLLEASQLLKKSDMRLFSAACDHYLAKLDSKHNDSPWIPLGVKNPDAFASMLLPGFRCSSR